MTSLRGVRVVSHVISLLKRGGELPYVKGKMTRGLERFYTRVKSVHVSKNWPNRSCGEGNVVGGVQIRLHFRDVVVNGRYSIPFFYGALILIVGFEGVSLSHVNRGSSFVISTSKRDEGVFA